MVYLKSDTRQGILKAWAERNPELDQADAFEVVAEVWGVKPSVVAQVVAAAENQKLAASNDRKPKQHKHRLREVSPGVRACATCPHREHDAHKEPDASKKIMRPGRRRTSARRARRGKPKPRDVSPPVPDAREEQDLLHVTAMAVHLAELGLLTSEGDTLLGKTRIVLTAKGRQSLTVLEAVRRGEDQVAA